MIELQPNRAEGYLRLGNVLVAADDFGKAKSAYLTALKLEPNHELTVTALRDMDRARKVSQIRKTVQVRVLYWVFFVRSSLSVTAAWPRGV